MENRLQATFMPRQSTVPGSGAYVRPKSPTSFLMLIGTLLFIFTLAAFAGLYVYKGFLKVENEKKKTTVEQAIKNFEPELTKELTVLKTRMDVGKQLLANHNAFSLLFALMELNTAQTVRFTDFSYSITPDQKVQLAMEGEARSYNAIAYQSDVFSKLEPLKSPLFSNLTLTEDGTITFDVSAELDPSSISYKKLVEGFTPPANTASSTSTTTPAANTGTTTPGRTGTTTSPNTPR